MLAKLLDAAKSSTIRLPDAVENMKALLVQHVPKYFLHLSDFVSYLTDIDRSPKFDWESEFDL